MIPMRDTQSGFSLVELLVAMLVTMVVSGAVFGLMAAGQGAFRREPELTDRQQNIRIAMNLIQRDVETAGSGMDPFEQAFTLGDGVNEAAPFLAGVGTAPDILEVKGPDPNCTLMPVDTAAAPRVTAMAKLPGCFGNGKTMVAVVMPTPVANDSVLWGWTFGNGGNGGKDLIFAASQPAKAEIGLWPAGSTPTSVMALQIARYAIANDNDGVPCLWRSQQGGLDDAGNRVLPGPTGAAGGWQLVARGIEDMQVQYRPPGGAFAASPPRVQPTLPAPTNFATLVQSVQVTLWARTVTPAALQGQTVRGGVTAIHGSLTTVTTPRAVLMTLRDPLAGGLQWQ